MPFYLRKSVSVGPFRFNLSKSGVGVSAGVKGFRIGTGPKGNYVHMGRGGFYYRASLDAPKQQQAVPQQQQPTIQILPEGQQEIESGNILEMVPSKAEDVIGQINEKLDRFSLWPVALVLGLLGCYFVNDALHDDLWLTVAFSLTFVLTCFAAYWDSLNKAVVILYDLDETTEASFKKLAEAFEEVSSCARTWNINTSGFVTDQKRNAGASHTITRASANLHLGAPKVVKTNVDIPCIEGGKQNVYFFPDIVLVTEGNKAGAVTYKDLRVEWGSTGFIESESVPRDSEVIGKTWRYVNKKGGPDRRFSNNREIPIVRYQEMTLFGPNDFRKLVQLSKVEDRTTFSEALSGLRAHVLALGSEKGLSDFTT